MERKESHAQETYEIDLIDIKEKLVQFLKKTTQLAIRFLFRRGIWLLVFMLVGGVFGYVYHAYYFTPDYRVSSLVQVNHVHPAHFVLHVNQLDSKLKSEGSSEVAKSLGLSEEELKQIISVQAHWLYNDQYLLNTLFSKGVVDDFLRNDFKHLVRLEFLVLSPNIISKLRDVLSLYINQNEWFSRINQMENQYFDKVIQKTQEQILMLDSTRNIAEHAIETMGQGKSIVFLSEPRSYHFDVLSLSEIGHQYRKRKELESSVFRPVLDFSIDSETTTESRSRLIRKMSLRFLFVGILFFLFLENRKRIMLFVREAKATDPK